MAVVWTTGELAARVGASCEGPDDRVLTGVAPLDRATPSDLSFCRGGRWLRTLSATRAGAVLLGPDLPVPAGTVALRCREVRYAYAIAASLLVPIAWPAPAIHPTASVDPTAVIGQGVILEPFAVVSAGAVIGEGCWLQGHSYVGRDAVLGQRCRLMPGAVVMERCRLGDRVWLHPGAVVGADGFGHEPGISGLVRVPQLGTAVLEDDVEVGANACVDRAALDETRIGRGTRLDNLVQVAHGVRIGTECLLAAFAGVAGGARLGDRVIMAGRTAVVDGIEVGDGAVFAGLASASRDVPPNAKIGGSPARSYRRWLREVASLRQLPALLKQVERLKRRVDAVPVEPIGIAQTPRRHEARAMVDQMDKNEILELLPHREPFLMVDRVIELDPRQRAVAIKEVRADEDWARGHFPGDPIFPGVLIAEALAQVAALIFLSAHRDRAGSAVYLVGIDKIRFRRPVRPGDELRLEVKVTGEKRRIWMFDGRATVDGERVAEGSFLATVQLEGA